MNIQSLDLNLFVAFEAVMESRSATLAARRLNLTQSAVSNALARLREALGDPLFVRSGRGLVPTPAAEAMAPRIAEALRRFEGLLQEDRGFDPGQCTRRFTLSCTDDQEVSDLPQVARRFADLLPRASLEVVSVDRLLAANGQTQVDVDLSLLPLELGVPGLHVAPLYVEEVAFVVRQDHPQVKGRALGARQFSELPHVEVHVLRGGGVGTQAVERRVRELGLRRNVALVVPHFLPAALAAATTDAVARLPLRFARHVCGLLPLKLVRPPFDPPRYPIGLAWHDRTHRDPVVGCFRDLVIAALREPQPSQSSRSRV
jgi:DNA-binding transcriptional LysR family regulator